MTPSETNKNSNGVRLKLGRSQRLATTLALSLSSPLLWAAGDFKLSPGVKGRWAAEAYAGASFRMSDPDPSLIFLGNGGQASSSTGDDGNLNFRKGDLFASQLKLLGEVELSVDNYSLFLRGKAYQDPHLKNHTVPFGSSATAYQAQRTLNDQGYEELSRFDDLQVMDAYVAATFAPRGRELTLKAGKQTVNWGEALFIGGGINQYSVLNFSATRRPGAELRELFVSVPQVYANLQLTPRVSLQGFIQTQHESAVADGCGTYFSPGDPLNCGGAGSVFNPGVIQRGPARLDFTRYNDRQGFSGGGTAVINGQPVNTANTPAVPGLPLNLAQLNFRMAQLPDDKPSDSGQFGLAARVNVPQLDAELGAYFVNYHQRFPVLSLVKTPSGYAGSLYNGISLAGQQVVNPMSYFADYSKTDIQVWGFSASTVVRGASVTAEISMTQDFPAQLNGVDLAKGAGTSTGPLAMLGNNQLFPLGSTLRGYRPLDKIQVQMSAVHSLPGVLGTSSVNLAAEFGAQFWKGIGDPFTDVRFGRSPTFGAGAHSSYGPCTQAVNPNLSNCTTDGFATSRAYGYRLLAVMDYPDVYRSISLKPRVFFAHDIKGNSADGVFLEDRKSLGLALRAELLSGKYFAELSYTRFGNSAYFDPFKDRDFATALVGVHF